MIGIYLDNLRKNGPLIHNITNYVTVNDVANVLLACGASPVMADEPEDAKEITAICGGLNINIGTLNTNTIEGMFVACEKAQELKHIMVLDPVGAGASKLRTNTARDLMKKFKFDVVKGNVSEIKVLASGEGGAKGVDADINDKITKDNLVKAIEFIKNYAKKINTIVAITGEIDLVSDGNSCYVITNGRKEMGKVTGTGCQLSALIAAFLVANPDKKLEATVAAVCTMGVAGEIGWSNMECGDGNATYRDRIIDAIYNMDGNRLDRGAIYEIK